MNIAVIIPAAGSGSRFGGEIPKQFLSLAGKPLIQHVIERFILFDVARIVVAVAEPLLAVVKQSGQERVSFVAGGETRQESVSRALREIPDEFGLVAVHDAVRPFFRLTTLAALLEAAAQYGAALPVMPVTDTIHVIRNGFVDSTLDRTNLAGAQTPQCFQTALLREILERAFHDRETGTDEAGLAVRYGVKVATLPGDPFNIKITRPDDLAFAESKFAEWSQA